MTQNGNEASEALEQENQHKLKYDEILKLTLKGSAELTILFANGIFGDDTPLDAPVEWLDKESGGGGVGIVSDMYPRIGGDLYSIEAESDDRGGMAVRMFKYSVGGAIVHNMAATDDRLRITFPKPCVVFLRSGKNTPRELTWDIEYYDGQTTTLKVPTIRLSDLSVKEIAERNLFPIGQFYLRTFEPLREDNLEDFRAARAELLSELKKAVDDGRVPYHVGLEMQDVIRQTAENTLSRSDIKKEGHKAMTDSVDVEIEETLIWTDYGKIFAEREAKAEARAVEKNQLEIAVAMFGEIRDGRSVPAIVNTLKNCKIPDDIITTAGKQAGVECAL
jgi:hypothetical protein